jgi:hypothetical protein
MNNFIKIFGIIFLVIVSIVLYRNYVEPCEKIISYVDTCFVDSSQTDTNISVFDTLVVNNN